MTEVTSSTSAPTREPVASGNSPANTARRRRLSATQRVLMFLEALVSVCALAGGAYMVTHASTVMSLDYLDGTWFHTWRWPGIALFFFIGVCPALVVVATLLRLRIAIIGHVSVGVGLVAWILLEAAWVVVSPGLQGTFGVIGLVIFVLGLREVRRVPAMRGGVMSASAGRESDPHLKSRGRWYLRCPGGGWTAPHAELESRAKRGGWPRDCQPASRDASRSDR
jgi:hypothetical protein